MTKATVSSPTKAFKRSKVRDSTLVKPLNKSQDISLPLLVSVLFKIGLFSIMSPVVAITKKSWFLEFLLESIRERENVECWSAPPCPFWCPLSLAFLRIGTELAGSIFISDMSEQRLFPCFLALLLGNTLNSDIECLLSSVSTLFRGEGSRNGLGGRILSLLVSLGFVGGPEGVRMAWIRWGEVSALVVFRRVFSVVSSAVNSKKYLDFRISINRHI